MDGKTINLCSVMTMPYMCNKVVVFDLDDTLYKEIDFLKSGYRKVADYVGRLLRLSSIDIYYNLLSWHSRGENAFARLNETYGIETPMKEYLDIYRYHQPNITLPEETKAALSGLKEAGVLMGIITDGRLETQNNKIEALGLSEWISDDFVFINEEQKYFKPNHWSFDRMMLKCFAKGAEADAIFYYVGDNPEKDFLGPNELRWTSICLLDNEGKNIHKQDFDLQQKYLPKYKVDSINELIALV